MEPTLRDQLAMVAFTALANTGRLVNATGMGELTANNESVRQFVRDVWRLADIMLEERGSAAPQ